jgi:hypothetical protein
VAQTFDSQSRAVGAILGPFERRPIVVPRFQRGFSWEKLHVMAFWNDMVAFSEEYEKAPKSATYFFGPIVVQNQTEEILLLDGQQRLATATILLAVIRDLARSLQFTKGHPGHDLAHEIQASLIQKEDSDPPFALRLGELDNDYFRKTVQLDPPDPPESTLRSHELIRGAYKTLREELERVVATLPPDDAIKRLKQIKDTVAKSMLVVAINVETEDDAYSIFETLNDRGLRLSVPDLLLNLLMRRANLESERSQVRQSWNYMLEQLGKRDISRFLRHMWLSRYGDLKTRGLFNELKIFLKDKKLSSIEFADSCSIDCDFYVALVDQTKDVPKTARNDIAGVVRHVGITSSLPLLLAGLQCLKDSDFAALARTVAVLSVRYSVLADLNPSTLESAFYEAARQIRANDDAKEPSPKILQTALAILTKLNPSDAIVREKAKEVTLERGPAVWIMGEVANYLQTKTNEVKVHEANLEHVFPRNATLTQWPNKAALEPYIWRLGNLTVLGENFNRSASNKAYALKSNNYYAHSELSITKSLVAKYTAWTPADVEIRSAEIAELMNHVFAL